MEQFTETWNECLQITDEEVIEARWEIQRLRGDIQHQEGELEKTRALLDQKDTKLCEAEKLYKVLLEEDTRVLGDNKSLNLELTSLRQQLSEEKTRGELLKEKHQESRSRLNEAIREQQDLFSRSRDLCQETMNQLRKEKACKVSVSDAVDKALETSHKKREEMKKCLEEYRWQTEKDTQQSEISYSSIVMASS
jgi:chromosome segregation ATPase